MQKEHHEEIAEVKARLSATEVRLDKSEREHTVLERKYAETMKTETLLKQQVALHCKAINSTSRRTLQADGPASQGDLVHIYKLTLSRGGLSQTTSASGGGHRRMQDISCDKDSVQQHLSQINSECCDEASEDCSGGAIHVCNAGCAALIQPIWAACKDALGAAAVIVQGAVNICPGGDQGGGAGAHAVQEFAMVCPDMVSTHNCVPKCRESINGDMLLLNIDGDDTKMTCELHQHTLYSWMGAAGDGGFIGHDHAAFISSVLSHAPGIFSLIVSDSIEVGTAVDMVAGQSATIIGEAEAPPVWTYSGSGAAFAIGPGAELEVKQVWHLSPYVRICACARMLC
jgi:hypothetical protein